MQGASQAGLPQEGGDVVDELQQPVEADEVGPKVKQLVGVVDRASDRAAEAGHGELRKRGVAGPPKTT